MKWNVWMEGYSATGEYSPASYEGEWEGSTFRDACGNWASQDKERLKYFNADRLTFWGCKLFANEEDARRAFG